MPEIRLCDYPYSPHLGWSTTRSETFRTCRRRYFFQYYSRFDPEVAPELLQRLKSLTSLPMLVGQAVHEVLAVLLRRLLRTSEPIDQERFGRHVEQTIGQLLASSELMEVVYGERPAPESAEILDPVMGCLERFLASERFAWLREVLPGDPPFLIEPPGYGETRLQGMKIYAKVDCLFRVDGSTLILDWKTGRPDPAKHLRQLLGYAAWAENHLELPAEQILCVAAYLQPEYQEVSKQPTVADLQGLATEVAAEIHQMESLCRDAERNIPLPKEAFPLTDNLGSCRHCQFRGLCGREGDPTGEPG